MRVSGLGFHCYFHSERSSESTLDGDHSVSAQCAFNAFKNLLLSDIALDDISLTDGICNVSLYPEPTLVPTPPPEVPSK